MRIALDTNRYSDFARGDEDVSKLIEIADEAYLPFAVVAELRMGFLGGSKGRQNERILQQFLRRPGISMLFPDEQTTQHYAAFALQLRRQGTPIPINDVWIAALCVQHGLSLYARDSHFDHLPQLLRI